MGHPGVSILSWDGFGYFSVFKDDILTIQEVAKVLKVSKRTVYRWVESGDLKVARIGRKTYRVFESDLRKFVRKYMN